MACTEEGTEAGQGKRTSRGARDGDAAGWMPRHGPDVAPGDASRGGMDGCTGAPMRPHTDRIYRRP